MQQREMSLSGNKEAFYAFALNIMNRVKNDENKAGAFNRSFT